MQTNKKIMKEEIEVALMDEKFGLTEHQAHILSIWMANMTQVEILRNAKELTQLHMTIVSEYEINRGKFRSFVETLQNTTKGILPELMKQGMVFYHINPKTKRRELKARSTVLTSIVKFLNQLDELCLEFYGTVYKYEDEPKVQTSLFPDQTNQLDNIK